MRQSRPEDRSDRPIGLVVDRDPTVRATIRERLEERGVMTLGAGSAGEAIDSLRNQPVSVLIIDARTPAVSNVSVIDYAMNLRPAPVIIVIASEEDLELGQAAVRKGAFDLLTHPLDHSRLRMLVDRTLQQLDLVRELDRLRVDLQAREGYHRIVGNSPDMERARRELGRLTKTDERVWLSGQSGTGKELAGRTLHANSARCEGPFAVVSCAGVSAADWEARWLAGSAGTARLFEDAAGGCVYLDGVSELRPESQEKLSQVLADGDGRAASAADVRLLSAASLPPREAVQQGLVPERLARQLASASLHFPPLVDRSADIALLARHFVSTIREINHLQPIRISQETMALLNRFAWPGNVQELRNAIEHAVILAVEGMIRPEDLPDAIRETMGEPSRTSKIATSTRPFREVKREVVEGFEAAYLGQLLERHRGNVTAAAHQAGMLRSALQRLLRKYGLKSVEFRKSRRVAARAELPKSGLD